MTGVLSALAILAAAGVMNASFTLPMKYTRRWAWENTWLAWTLFALILLPLVVAFGSIPLRLSSFLLRWELIPFDRMADRLAGHTPPSKHSCAPEWKVGPNGSR